jgi:hypothetical protein
VRPTRTSGDPHDRLTRIGDRLITALEADPEYQDDTLVAMLANDQERRRGTAIYGFESDSDAIAEMFVHLAALFEANGQMLRIVPITNPGAS